MGVVLDTSVAMKLFYREEDTDLAFNLMRILIKKQEPIHAMDLMLYELGQGAINKRKDNAVFSRDYPLRMAQMNVQFHMPEPELLSAALTISTERDLTFYDSSHVALSEKMGFTLVTEDRKILNNSDLSVSMKEALEKL